MRQDRKERELNVEPEFHEQVVSIIQVNLMNAIKSHSR